MTDSNETPMALGEQHNEFLNKVRFGFDKENDWEHFYLAFQQSISSFLPENGWSELAVKKFVPTLRDEISKDVYAGYENGVLAVLLIRRIQAYLDAIQRWAVTHNATSLNDYDYVTTAYIALHSLYRDASQPAWVHDVLSEALRVGRKRLENMSMLDSFLDTFAGALTNIRKVALDDKEVEWWHIYLRVHVRLYQILYGDQLTLRHDGLRNPEIRCDVVRILKEHKNDRVALPLIMDRIRVALEKDGVPFCTNHPVAIACKKQKLAL